MPAFQFLVTRAPDDVPDLNRASQVQVLERKMVAHRGKKGGQALAGGMGGRETWPQRDTLGGVHWVSHGSPASGSMLPPKKVKRSERNTWRNAASIFAGVRGGLLTTDFVLGGHLSTVSIRPDGRRSFDAWKAERRSRRLQGRRQATVDRPAVRLVPVRRAEGVGEAHARGLPSTERIVIWRVTNVPLTGHTAAFVRILLHSRRTSRCIRKIAKSLDSKGSFNGAAGED
jgi:hypothetical protein